VGPIIGCVAIQWLSIQIGTQQMFNSNLVLGAVLIVFVVLVPKGIVPTIGTVIEKVMARLRRNVPADIGAPVEMTAPTKVKS
jgi:hypothetical protein